MFKGATLRKKIIIAQVVLFLIFAIALFPLIQRTVYRLVRDTLIENTADLIDFIDDAKTEKMMIERLKKQELFTFFRISILDGQGKLLYDSHLSRLYGEQFKKGTQTDHPEVKEAIEKGEGYLIAKSDIFRGKFAYVAQKFTLGNQSYILRTAFPFVQLEELIQNFAVGFILFSIAILLFFNAIIWIIFSRITRPIETIVKAIAPFQKGEAENIPKILLPKQAAKEDEFSRLAFTLNALSSRIHEQIENITAEKNEKQAILESLGEGVIAVDKDGKVRYVNYLGSKMVGRPRRELFDKPLPTEGPLLSRVTQLLDFCQEQETIMTDSIALGEEKKIYIDLIAAPKAEGSGAIIVLQDKSSHYKVLEMGKDFVANASHELRTPITIIKGFAETLQDMPEMSREMLDEITEKIVRNCQRMDNLVKNLLTLADIENIPESRFRETDLSTLLDNCRHMARSVYSNANIHIEKPEETILIEADSDLLELAIVNLLTNAAKYSKDTPEITITLQSKNEEEITLSIADKGVGIPAEDLEHIFERFYTVDKTHSRRLGGAGLGLSIVKTIIDKHDGRIEAESEVDKGTIFILTLPRTHHHRI